MICAIARTYRDKLIVETKVIVDRKYGISSALLSIGICCAVTIIKNIKSGIIAWFSILASRLGIFHLFLTIKKATIIKLKCITFLFISLYQMLCFAIIKSVLIDKYNISANTDR